MMLHCGAVFARTGPLNTRSTIGLAGKGTNIQRQVSTIAKNKFLRSHLLEVQSQSLRNTQSRANTWGVLTSHVSIKCINSSCARALCLRKIRTHLLAQSSFCTTDVRSKTDVRHLSKGEFESEEQSSRRNDTGTFNVKDIFDDSGEEPHHRTHVRKEHELKYSEIEKLYPNARSKINEIYVSIRDQLKQKNVLQIDYQPQTHKQKRQWTCTMRVTWPENMSISALAGSKPGAAKVAAIKTLQWLHNHGKLKNGYPVIHDSKVIQDMIKKPTKIVVKPDTLRYIQNLLDTYNDEIHDLIENSSANTNFRDISLSTEITTNPVGRTRDLDAGPEHLSYRNAMLKKRVENRPPSMSRELPIADYKQQIIREISNNRALLIKGDTGCGKTTQVPQYIMDSFASEGRATDCNMIVSQPRRISAITLAERIAEERREQIGDVVGYQVRLQQMLPQVPAGMLFCTSGVLLRKLQSNPTLKGCSHVILDEAHERSINTDMLMVLLKRALQTNLDLKVVVMSATINADLFQNYFDCGVVEVPGRTFPVEMNFLEDVEALGIAKRREYVGDNAVPEVPFVDCEQIGELVIWITKNKPPGAILCFLPGWSEIIKVKKYLEERRYRSGDVIVPVHSRMSHQDQRKIFQRPAPGVRKIVLATDIAETGITVADVVYVVDSAARKALRWHDKKGLSSVETQYASQANLLQRKGRAGRVQPGTSYHMVTRSQFENLEVHPLPEVLRSSLEQTVLDCKTYSNEKAESFLGSMPQPPTAAAVRKAIDDLATLGALDENENLTPLGKRIALFSVHPKLSKAMVYASIFQCVAPMITIASVMSAENEIFAGTLSEKESIRRIKQDYHPTSDHVSIVWLYEQWASMNRESRDSVRKFCWDRRLYPERMYTLSRVRDLNAEHLVQCHMLDSVQDYDDPEGTYNELAGLDEMVRAVLLSGMDQLLQHRNFDLRKGRVKNGTNVFIMEDGTRATITPESVNFKKKSFPSPFMTYVRRQHSEERRTSLIRETSIISPVTALLFTQSKVHGFQEEDTKTVDKHVLLTIKGRKNFKLACDPNVAPVLLKLRDSMWNVVRYFVENQGFVEHTEGLDHEKIDDYRRRMLQVVGTLLSEAAERIDNPETKENDENEDYNNDNNKHDKDDIDSNDDYSFGLSSGRSDDYKNI